MPSGIDRIAQIDLWEKDIFDKFKWEDAYFGGCDSGVLRLLTACRRKFGQIARRDHVPVIWQRAKDIQAEMGVSADGYWGPLKRAEELGLVFRIDQHGHPGTRKLLICKLPEESEFHALARAKGALSRYMKNKPAVPRWVLQAIETELNNRLTAQTLTLVVERCAGSAVASIEPLVCRGSASARQDSSLWRAEAPTYIEQETNRNLSGEESQTRSEADVSVTNDEPPPPPTSSVSKNVSEQPTDEESPRRPLEEFLRETFALYRLSVSDTTFALLAEFYEEAMGDTQAVRQMLRAKVIRLAEAKFPAAKIAGYLFEDCPSPSAPPAQRAPNSPTPVQYLAEFEDVVEFEAVRERMRQHTSSTLFEKWLAPLRCAELGERVVLVAPDEFACLWVIDQFMDVIAAAFDEVYERFLPIEIIPAMTMVDDEARENAAYVRGV